MSLCFAQNLDSRVHVQKRRRSDGCVEAFEHVLLDSETSETCGYLVWVILVAERFSYEDYMDTVGCVASAGDDSVAAHALRREAVVAEAGCCTGGLLVQADAIGGGCDVAHPFDGVFHRRHKFVHAHDHYDFIRTVDQRCDAVSVAVDVNQLPIESNGIGTHKIDITAESVTVHLFGLLGSFCLAAVDQVNVIAVFQHIHNAAF